MRRDNLIHDFVFKALAGESVAVFESHFVRQFVHIRDIAAGVVFAIKNWKNLQGEIFNVGNPAIELTKGDLVKIISRFVNFRFQFDNNAGFDLERRNYPMSFEKFIRRGFSPEVSLEAGIEEILNHYRHDIVCEANTKELAHAA
jgi:nucleoside-diphosphate-sugar epimerase